MSMRKTLVDAAPRSDVSAKRAKRNVNTTRCVVIYYLELQTVVGGVAHVVDHTLELGRELGTTEQLQTYKQPL